MNRPLAFLVLASLASVASAQSVVAMSRSSITPLTGWPYGAEDDRGNPTAETNLAGTAGKASGGAWGDYGGMHTQGKLDVPGAVRASGFGRLIVSDSLNVVSANAVGRGTLVLSYSLSGAVSVSAAPLDPDRAFWAEATCTSVIRVNNAIVANDALQYRTGTYFPTPQYLDQFGPHTLTIDFDFDQPVSLETTVSALAYVENASGSALADFGSTFKWTGVAGVYDAQGQALSDFRVMGASGLDYANPQAVPEPAALASLAVGAASLLKRRRRSAQP